MPRSTPPSQRFPPYNDNELNRTSRANAVKLTEDAIAELSRLLQILQKQDLQVIGNISVVYRNVMKACGLLDRTMPDQVTQPKNPLTWEEERWYQAVITKKIPPEVGWTDEFTRLFVRRSVALGYLTVFPDEPHGMVWGPRYKKFGYETISPDPETDNNVVNFPKDPTDDPLMQK